MTSTDDVAGLCERLREMTDPKRVGPHFHPLYGEAADCIANYAATEHDLLAVISELETRALSQANALREMEATLRQHHDWHLQAGTIGLQDGESGWIEINNAAEYSDSAMYERTEKLLAHVAPEELQPMPRGGINTWWWEQAVLLRRKLRKSDTEREQLRQIICQSAAAIGNGAAVSSECSLQFMANLPGEIAAYTDKLRRFLKCSRDEGTEALDRAAAAESERDTLRARLKEAEKVIEPFAELADICEKFKRMPDQKICSWRINGERQHGPTTMDCIAARAFIIEGGATPQAQGE